MVLMTEVSAPIVGLSSVERMEDAIAAVNLELSADEIKNLEEAYIPKPIFGHS
jgi:aryl-alcohol dehydrogenase-like predicted oxidoreductase